MVEAVNALRAEKNAEIAMLRNETDRRLAEKDGEIADLTNRLNRMEAMLKRLVEK